MEYNTNKKKVKEFIDLLIEIYGKVIVSNLIRNFDGSEILDNKNEIFIKSLKLILTGDLNKIYNNLLGNHPNYGSKEIKNIIKSNRIDFQQIWNGRIIDFVSFTDLDFGKTNVKQIMIIGNDPSPQITQIGICYGLKRKEMKGSYRKFIKPKMRGRETRFWNYLKYIFRKSRLILENNVYITDTCKMYFKNISKSLGQVIKEKSYHLYLKKEIELIHPKLIVFNGVKAYQLVKDIELDKIKHKKNIKEKFFPEKKPRYEVFGIWYFNKDLKIHFLTLRHLSQAGVFKSNILNIIQDEVYRYNIITL